MMDDIGSSEDDMSPMPNQAGPTPDIQAADRDGKRMMKEAAFGDPAENLSSNQTTDASGKPKTAEALSILGAGKVYGAH